ncbi:hypothetical protein O0I10_007670 [Lichtheimia ornata]|uniref:F-box domain-containing protein n=1 Tax=Lichtheimia ornata TaxID=688661 RepID=A0AAD7V0U7_9FUNG|nr:uncharacterized protein O0I10_007670 [Lichtheimia ornata]KAJ8656593.1 hypothetical protein O0I10_007670 [Lichtheimia ornata]
MYNMIDVLPYDVLLQIFALLSIFDVLQCMRVSRQWYASVPDYRTVFPGYVVLNGEKYCGEYARSMAKVGDCVRSIVLKKSTYHSETDGMIGSLIPRFFRNISTLFLEDCGIQADLGRCLGKLPQLSYLKISPDIFIPVTTTFIKNILRHSPNITYLSIGGATEFIALSNGQFATRAPASRCTDLRLLSPPSSCINLQYLDVRGCEITIVDLEKVLLGCICLKFLGVRNEGDKVQNRAIMDKCCHNLRQLCYLPYNFQPVTACYDEIDDRQPVSNTISLRALDIDVTDAGRFIDQSNLKHLSLLHCYGDLMPNDHPWDIFYQNRHSLNSIGLALGVAEVEAYISSLGSFQHLTSLHLYLSEVTLSTDIFNQLQDMAQQHPSLQSIALSIAPIPLENQIRMNSAKVSSIARIPHLRRIDILSWRVHGLSLLQLFSIATVLQHIEVHMAPLQVTSPMFLALARLPLVTLVLSSEGYRLLGILDNDGLSYFVDHHAGPLAVMTVTGNFHVDKPTAKTLEYAREKLGNRFRGLADNLKLK